MRQLIAVGDSISCPAGRYTVKVIKQEFVYRVEVLTGGIAGQLVDDISASYPAQRLARNVARTITRRLRAGETVEQVRQVILGILNGEQAFAAADPTPAGATAGALLATTREQLLTDAERVDLDDLAARIRADLEARTRQLRLDAVNVAQELRAILGGPRQPANFRELRDAHQQAEQRDRRDVA